MEKIKVNVWQMGYTTFKDYVMGDKEKAECRPMGYVLLDDDEDWAEETWNLLNWSCWNYDENGDYAIKPESVFSPLDHCNSDIIVQIDGTDVFMCADFAVWTMKHSLADAVQSMKNGYNEFWPFEEVRRGSGHIKRDGDKTYIKIGRAHV